MQDKTTKNPVQACWISANLHKELRVAAAQDELRIGSLVETLVINWLAERQANQKNSK